MKYNLLPHVEKLWQETKPSKDLYYDRIISINLSDIKILKNDINFRQDERKTFYLPSEFLGYIGDFEIYIENLESYNHSNLRVLCINPIAYFDKFLTINWELFAIQETEIIRLSSKRLLEI